MHFAGLTPAVLYKATMASRDKARERQGRSAKLGTYRRGFASPRSELNLYSPLKVPFCLKLESIEPSESFPSLTNAAGRKRLDLTPLFWRSKTGHHYSACRMVKFRLTANPLGIAFGQQHVRVQVFPSKSPRVSRTLPHQGHSPSRVDLENLEPRS